MTLCRLLWEKDLRKFRQPTDPSQPSLPHACHTGICRYATSLSSQVSIHAAVSWCSADRRGTRVRVAWRCWPTCSCGHVCARMAGLHRTLPSRKISRLSPASPPPEERPCLHWCCKRAPRSPRNTVQPKKHKHMQVLDIFGGVQPPH